SNSRKGRGDSPEPPWPVRSRCPGIESITAGATEVNHPYQSRKTNVFARIHLEVQSQRIRRIRLNHFFHELHVDGVFAEDGVFVHRLKIDRDEERPGQLRIDPLSALDAQDLWNFQELHPCVHHHRLHTSGRDIGLELVEGDMVNHES